MNQATFTAMIAQAKMLHAQAIQLSKNQHEKKVKVVEPIVVRKVEGGGSDVDKTIVERHSKRKIVKFDGKSKNWITMTQLQYLYGFKYPNIMYRINTGDYTICFPTNRFTKPLINVKSINEFHLGAK